MNPAIQPVWEMPDADLYLQTLDSNYAQRFARNFEDALWGMWQRHREQTGPAA